MSQDMFIDFSIEEIGINLFCLTINHRLLPSISFNNVRASELIHSANEGEVIVFRGNVWTTRSYTPNAKTNPIELDGYSITCVKDFVNVKKGEKNLIIASETVGTIFEGV